VGTTRYSGTAFLGGRGQPSKNEPMLQEIEGIGWFQIHPEFACLIYFSSNQHNYPPETNIAPENRPLEKEIPVGNHHF